MKLQQQLQFPKRDPLHHEGFSLIIFKHDVKVTLTWIPAYARLNLQNTRIFRQRFIYLHYRLFLFRLIVQTKHRHVNTRQYDYDELY